jgi:2,3-bisphosphoglycerate-independent phosphoglycerate mutase
LAKDEGKLIVSVLLVFIDGLGIGEENPHINPCANNAFTVLHNVKGDVHAKPLPHGGVMVSLEATLGIEGLPQSATGQTALLTGENASKVLGYHKQGFPNKTLREILMEKSILKKVSESGQRAAFMNAFRPRFFQYHIEEIISKLSVTTVANWAASLPFFTLQDIIDRRALYQDFTNLDLIERGFNMPIYTPQQAGEILALEAPKYDFCLYEYFKTDHAGHSQDMDRASKEIAKLEAFITTLLNHIDFDQCTLIVTSDHGNIEDLSVRTHTKNKVPAMMWGSQITQIEYRLRSLTDIVPFVLDVLDKKFRSERKKETRQGSKQQIYHGKEVIPCL